MHVTTTPAEKSSLKVEVELPVDRVERAVADATRRLSQRTRVAGFRPGKAPRRMLERELGDGAVWEEAVESLVDQGYRDWLESIAEDPAIVVIGRPEIDLVEAEEGKPLKFTALVPLRPTVALGDYTNFPFSPEIETVDAAKVDRVIDELRDQQATHGPIEDRAAQKGDWAVIDLVGMREGEPADTRTAERMPVIIGEGRLPAGFEDHLVGLRKGESREFDIVVGDDDQDESLRGATIHFKVDLHDLREKILPPADDDFAQSLGGFEDMATLRAEITTRMERSALDRARHGFADRIIDYAVKNATVDLPDLLVEEEVDVMVDELKSALGRQGITEEQYETASGKSFGEVRGEFRPGAEERAKTLLVLGEIAVKEGVDVADEEILDEVARAKSRYADQPKLLAYFDTPRAQAAIRASLRRSRVVEMLIDRWLAAHPEHPAIPHLEDEHASSAAESNAEAVEEPSPEASPA